MNKYTKIKIKTNYLEKELQKNQKKELKTTRYTIYIYLEIDSNAYPASIRSFIIFTASFFLEIDSS